MIKIKVAPDLGYCMGVSQAIEKALDYAEKHGRVYSLGTVAHNEEVVEHLRKHGVIPVDPKNVVIPCTKVMPSHIVITAHGAPPETYKWIGYLSGASSLDCTCPIVQKGQGIVEDLSKDGFDVVIFGDREHQEVKGLVGWGRGRVKFVGTFNQLFTPGQDISQLGLGRKVCVVSQTTQIPSMYADFVTTLVNRHINEFQEVRVFNTICPVVVKRLEDARTLAREMDIVLVVGSRESANTRNLERVCQGEPRLRPVSEVRRRIILIQGEDQVGAVLGLWYQDYDMVSPNIGITAGTSTPIEVVQKVIAKLEEMGGKQYPMEVK